MLVSRLKIWLGWKTRIRNCLRVIKTRNQRHVLKVQRENSQAKQFQMEIRQKEQAKVEEASRKEAAVKRVRYPREYFEGRMRDTVDSGLFDQHEIKLKGRLTEIEGKVMNALTEQLPASNMKGYWHPNDDTFFLRVEQDLKPAGKRICHMVGGQINDGEVMLIYKVFEYVPEEVVTGQYTYTIRLFSKEKVEKKMVPIHPSRVGGDKRSLLARREEGVRMIGERIRVVTGE